MALLQATLRLRVWGQICTNVFHYAATFPGGVEGASEALFTELSPQLVSALGACLDDAVTLVSLTVKDLYDDSDFFDHIPVPETEFGAVTTSSPMPPFVALAFRSVRKATGVNRWYKRFAGVPEVHVSGNTWTQASTLGDDLAAVLSVSQDITAVPFNLTVYPCLLRKEPYTTPNGNAGYRFFATESEQRENMWLLDSGDISFYRLTTQRSRLEGVGS